MIMTTYQQTILVVDDMAENFKLLNHMLGQDYRMLYATNGRHGMDLAFTAKPDIILLDVMMPELDGYEVCARLKANPVTRSIPVIFVTAMKCAADEARGLDVGAIDYITRPFSPAIVRARVRNHLELKRHRDYLGNLSATDGLTGIPNRRHFEQILEREWRRAMRNHSGLSLIMMDIDFFKGFNDHYGHLSGDDCLRHVAQALAESTQRPFDLVARYGGDEFACVLPETEAAGAVSIADKLREQVHALHIPHARSLVADHVTLSLGVATLVPESVQLPSDLIEQADRHLFKAKQNGHNQLKSGMSPISPVSVERDKLQMAIFSRCLSGARWSAAEQPKFPLKQRTVDPLVSELLPRAMERLAGCAGELAEAGRLGCFVEASRLGHTIKGLAMTFGLAEAELLGGEIEGAVQVGDAGRIEKLAGRVRELTMT
jgi:diguanylate cyclase (GGDEF)-like protein